MSKRRFSLSTTHIILLSFLIAILIGSLLLSLPVSSASGEAIPYVDALFTATTSTCVTGLVTVPTVTSWSTFGHVVILILIQIGGLGVITVMAGLTMALQRRMGLQGQILIQDAFNLNTLSGLTLLVRKVILGTFLVEGIGAVLYMTVFVPEFGPRGVWISVFTSVSAFCNAGIDISAVNSLCDYARNPVINCVTCGLVILGGIGFTVWWDVIQVIRLRRKQKIKLWRNLKLHSKIALSTSLILILGGAVCFFAFEYHNPLTMGDLSIPEKIQASLFQSVTTRTAGFATIPQENLTNASALVALLLMFIGGSPVGTAGGVKTVTIAVLIASAVASIRNQNDVNLFRRSVSKEAIRKAIAVVCMSFGIMFISAIALSAVTDGNALDILYESVSATATVGLTRNLTSSLNLWGKLIIIGTMYLGRVGPISLAVAFRLKKSNPNKIKEPMESISVG